MNKGTEMEPILSTNKAVAASLGRSERYVTDMRRGGFRLPCRPSEALNFLRRHPTPTALRSSPSRSKHQSFRRR